MLILRVETPDGGVFDHSVQADEVKIGRSSSADLSLADRFLSRLHARLFLEESDWWLEDLGSRNGTYLNGDKIEAATKIKAGDTIRVSGCRLQTHFDEPADVAESTNLEATLFRSASDLLQQDSAVAANESPEALRGFAERLRVLNDVHEALSRPISLQELLDLILARAFEHVGYETGTVFLRRDDGRYERAAHRSVGDEGGEPLYSETLLREVGDKGQAALVLDAGTDERFRDARSIMGSGVRSLVAAPLMDAEGSLGLIVLSSTLHRRQFEEGDMSLLTSLAAVAALRIRNVALAVEAAENRRLQEELDLARSIQVALLPASLPEVEGYVLCGRNLPSRGVSGDFYEVIRRQHDCFLLIADVSGKGIAASLLTASFEALAAGPIEEGLSPEKVTASVSKHLFERTPPAKYATAWLGTLDPANGRVRYTNAGHNPALHIHASRAVDILGPTGVPVGLLPGSIYTEAEIKLEPGDLLLLYTDGITESENVGGDEYGLDRLMEFSKAHAGDAAAAFAKGLEESVDRFTGEQPAADDRTIVVIQRLES